MGIQIKELPETSGIKKEDLLIVEDTGGTKKGTVQELDEALGVSSLKEDLDNRAVINGGKNLIGNVAKKLYAVGRIPEGTKITMSMQDNRLLAGNNLLTYDANKVLIEPWNALYDRKTRTVTLKKDTYYLALDRVVENRPMQVELGSNATKFVEYKEDVPELIEKIKEDRANINALNTGLAQSIIFSSFGFYKSSNQQTNLGIPSELITSDYYNSGELGSGKIQSLFGKLSNPMQFSETKTLYLLINSSITNTIQIHLSNSDNWASQANPLVTQIKLIKGYNLYKVDLRKQYSDEYYENPTDFNYLLFETNNDVPFENLVFDVYAFDNPYLYDFIQSERNKNEYDYEIAYWGDSLTAGAGGSGTTYPTVCSNELGITSYINAGVGGETANTIACRNGSNNMIIPIGNVNGTYSIGDLKDQYGTNILPLRQGTGNDTVNPITINGYNCTLLISQTSAIDPNATYTISGYNGESIKYPMPCKFSGCDLTSKITVIFVGQNGPSFEQRLSIIDSMISKTNGKYVVLTLSSGTEEQMKSQENTMLSKYGNHLFKTREMLSKYGMELMNLTPTEDDTTAITNGSVPPSLRYDGVHLNAKGYTALGKMLASHIRALGYVD